VSLEDRVASLERDNRHLKVILLTVASIFAAVFLMGQTRPPTSLTGESLTLWKPGSSRIPAVMMFTDDKGITQVSVHDSKGESRIRLSFYDDGTPYVRVQGSGEKGYGLVAAGMLADDSRGRAGLYVSDAQNNDIWGAP